MATMKQVAERAGVSTSTVSHVINGTRAVSVDVRERVLGLIDAMGYIPNAMARSLRNDKTHTIGVALPDNGNPCFAELLRGIEDAAFEAGYHVMLCRGHADPERQAVHLRGLIGKRIDGLVLASCTAAAEQALVPLLAGLRVPLVLAGQALPGVAADCIGLDHEATGHAKLCIKPSRGIYGIGFAVVDEERSSAALLLAGVEYHIGYQDLRRGLAELGEFRTMLLMEYLDGHEYSVDCVGDRGRLVAAVARRKLAGAGSGQLIDMRPEIIEATTRLTADYGLNGVFNVQFREAAGKPRLLEINPRMSGGIGMACAAGPNLPWIALKGFADGFDTVAVPPVANGMRVIEMPHALELP